MIPALYRILQRRLISSSGLFLGGLEPVCCYCDCHAWVGTPLSRPSFTAYTPSDQEVKLTFPLIPFLTLKWHLLRFLVVQQERTRRHLALYHHLSKRPSYPPITDHSIMNKPMRGRTPPHSLIPLSLRLVDVRHRTLAICFYMSLLFWRHPLFYLSHHTLDPSIRSFSLESET